jgi:hypothetical protein
MKTNPVRQETQKGNYKESRGRRKRERRKEREKGEGVRE